MRETEQRSGRRQSEDGYVGRRTVVPLPLANTRADSLAATRKRAYHQRRPPSFSGNTAPPPRLMCIIFYSTTLASHALYVPLHSSHSAGLTEHDPRILSANRDEFLGRPTTSSTWHSFPSSPPPPQPTATSTARVLSGIDLEGGGTWLGVSLPSEKGHPSNWSPDVQLRFSTLTNYTEVIPPARRPSRGDLVKDFLVEGGCGGLEEYLGEVEAQKEYFAGFNLLVGELVGGVFTMGYVSNREERGEEARVIEGDSVVGLSNDVLRVGEQVTWPKVISGCKSFDNVAREMGAGPEEELVDALLTVLRSVHRSDARDRSTDAPSNHSVHSTASSVPITRREHLRHTVLVRPTFLNPKAPLPSSPALFVPPPSSTPTSSTPSPWPPSNELEKEGASGGHWYATRVQTILLVSKPDAAGRTRVVMKEREAYRLNVETNEPEWSGAVQSFDFTV